MIKKLHVKNFKSLRDVKLNCTRVNIFIGRPNSGKSNILEVIGLLSSGYHGFVNKFVRLESPLDLFFGRKLQQGEIQFDLGKIKLNPIAEGLVAWFERQDKSRKHDPVPFFRFSFSGGHTEQSDSFEKYKLYRFRAWGGQVNHLQYLCPPGGGNLPLLVYNNNKLLYMLQGIFNDFGLRLSVDVRKSSSRNGAEYLLQILHDTGDLPVTYSWEMVSETLQRMVFYLAAIVTNKDCILAFEEPEAHAFPYYTKFLAERIAMDNSNQYFMATHNPYFLMSLLEKTPKKELACFVVDMRNYETIVKKLTQKQVADVMNETSDVFFSIDRYIEED